MLNSDEERLMREQIADLHEAEGQQFLEQLIEEAMKDGLITIRGSRRGEPLFSLTNKGRQMVVDQNLDKKFEDEMLAVLKEVGE